MPRHHPRLAPAVAPVLLAAGVLLNGCGKSKETPNTESGPKVLNCTIGNDLSNMDPAQINDTESAMVASHVYQGLLRFRPDSVEVEPDLAESYDVTTDGLKWTFRLRRNVRFHDGTPLTSEAVRTSVMRQMDEHHPLHAPGRMRYAKLIFGDLHSTETQLVTDVHTPDEHTVVFTLARRYVPFAKNLAMTPASIISPVAATTCGKDLSTTMVGTGPFRLRDYRQDLDVVLERNPDYWNGRPALDEIRFRVIHDASVRLNSIRKGESDVVSGIEPTAIEALRKSRDIVVMSKPSMSLGYLSMNNARVPFDNRLVRLALNYAIDKETIANTLFHGESVVAKGVIPPGMLGHSTSRAGFPYDPTKAKQLLAEAGYPNGFTVHFSTHDRKRHFNPVGAKLAEQVQRDLAKVGITATIDQMEYPTFLDRAKSRQFAISNNGWVSDNGDPDNFIFELIGREDNEMNYVNPEATLLMREASAEMESGKRAEMYRKAEDLVIANPPCVFLNHAKQTLAVRKRVKNLALHPTGITQLHTVDVEP